MGLVSCIDEYVPKISKYENLLVIDGSITNQPGPQIISLSRSANVSEPDTIPVTNAEVRIQDNIGNTFPLIEIKAGVYQSDSSLTGIIGNSYLVEFKTSEGITYKSDFEELKIPVEIDTVYHEITYQQDADYPYDLVGYEFYINTKRAEEDESYLKWDMTATYLYQSEYTIRWYFDGELHWFHGPDSLYNCWTTNRIGKVITSSTNILSNPVNYGLPLHFVSTETRELSVRYSLLVKQHTISKNAYNYWNEIQKQNSEDANLYTTQPHFIKGNVYNISNPDELVLGYFTVSGTTEMRIFVDRPPPNIPMRYLICTLTEGDFEAYGQMSMADPVTYPIYAIETPGGRRAVPNKYCVDCRLKGGTIEKPDFWID